MPLEQFRKCDMILVCGLPGSGKSFFARKYFSKAGRKRINRKEITKTLYEMLTFNDKWSEDKYDLVDENLVKQLEKRIIEHLFQLGEPILLDNMSISAESREAYVAMATRSKKTISAIFVNTDLATCLKRNKERAPEEMVPESIISNLVAKIQFPERKEGFKDVLILDKFEDELK